MKAVAIPKKATSHIQKTAPGPPRVTAIATPAMLPVPTREAMPIAKAWKEEMPSPSTSRESKTCLTIWPNRRICTKPVRIVK